MPQRTGNRRQEILLLPECLDDYVGEDNPVRALDLFVDQLDLPKLGFSVKEKHSVGRPVEFLPQQLLKLHIYGYLNQIRSSRKLERETKRNLEVIWLMEKAQPDHWTINEFRRRNKKAFKNVLREFHKICDLLELFGKEIAAIDGSFFKALNNKSKNFTAAKLEKLEQKIDAAIEAYDQALEENDLAQSDSEEPSSEQAESESEDQIDRDAFEEMEVKNFQPSGSIKELQAKKQRLDELKQRAERSASGQVSLTDPDSRLLKKGNQCVVGHNVQCAVDSKSHLIAHIAIAQAGNDANQLEPLAKATCEALKIDPEEESPLHVVADSGYYNCAQIDNCEKENIAVHVPARTTTAVKTPGYRVDDFEYDEENDKYICPQGSLLHRHSDTTRKEIVYQTYYNTSACSECELRTTCTKGKFRKLHISEYRAIERKVAKRIEDHPEIYSRRKELAELPFGTMKAIWGYSQFMLKGKQGCEAELNLMGFCFNWKRALNLVGIERLMEAISLFLCSAIASGR